MVVRSKDVKLSNILVRSKEGAKIFVLIRKRHIKGGKHIAPMNFAEYLEKQTFQRIAEFIMSDFDKMDFMKGIVILIKVDEMYLILKSVSHCLLVER